ncbi:MAG TPA: Gfo/Idh/MocA family oxidoreductase, partial [Phnomibacter sp.]|nr:Gfo/Idh/MocA family oxidoreductase [Phnomibacter sp.]
MQKNRRSFLQQLGLAGAGLLAGSSTALAKGHTQQEQPISRQEPMPFDGTLIRLGLIGAGGMGVEDTKTALQHAGVTLTAVADLYKGRLDAAKATWGNQLFTTTDYKALLNRPDVDAVIIGTPDHWHMPISVDALKAGKHVYCEKPMLHKVSEGQALLEAWQKSGKVMVVG